jgi:hypothetical protein
VVVEGDAQRIEDEGLLNEGRRGSEGGKDGD